MALMHVAKKSGLPVGTFLAPGGDSQLLTFSAPGSLNLLEEI